MFEESMDKLKKSDIYSMLLFVLYQVENIEEYSTASQLVYVLDQKNFLNLCNYFGGTTLKIPTVEQLEILLYSLLLYQKVNIEKEDQKVALSSFNLQNYEIKKIKRFYNRLCEVLDEYEFNIQ